MYLEVRCRSVRDERLFTNREVQSVIRPGPYPDEMIVSLRIDTSKPGRARRRAREILSSIGLKSEDIMWIHEEGDHGDH